MQEEQNLIESGSLSPECFASNSELLTVKDVAKLLRISRVTVYRMLADGRLKGIPGALGCRRFHREELEAFTKRQG